MSQVQDAAFNVLDDISQFGGRVVSPRVDISPQKLRVDVREKHHPLPRDPVKEDDTAQTDDRQESYSEGMSRRKLEQSRIQTYDARKFIDSSLLHQCYGSPGRFLALSADYGTQHGREEKCVEQRAGQNGKHRYGQVPHKTATDAGPKHKRQKGRQRRTRRGHDRPEHTSYGVNVRRLGRFSLVQLAVGQLDDHDGAVNQHAEAEQHAEHHHEVIGVAQKIHDDERKQEREGDCQGHQDS